jgi:hypothetical protein
LFLILAAGKTLSGRFFDILYRKHNAANAFCRWAKHLSRQIELLFLNSYINLVDEIDIKSPVRWGKNVGRQDRGQRGW